MPHVSIKNINKIYDNKVQAVFDFNLDIQKGEFIVLVGPSGCGKSTTLRMIAGLEDITSGSLEINGNDVTTQPAKNRDIAMVFQNYALYGHMSIYENMAFSLKLRKENPNIIHKKVLAAAEILNLTDQLNKKPKNLSGGQRQRVAVGRAIVRNPEVFLFDEPLSNLDAKLRGSMRRELKLLHHRLGTTMIYVTHDQIEALTLADRIVVMSDGYVQQVGTPLELYAKPTNLFVASFIGLPPMNFMDVSFNDKGCCIENQCFILKDIIQRSLKNYGSTALTLGVRPEDIVLGGDLDFKVKLNENLGQYTLVHGKIGEDINLVCKFPMWCNFKPGDMIKVGFDQDKMHFFDKQNQGQRVSVENNVK